MHVPADEMAAVFKTLKKLDKERYFALPVTDEMAPLYSKVNNGDRPNCSPL